ncbi:hypothetical protein [uncultured Desulfobulbus sp.]|uniref:hypothetical protein n=1 Tax=uncultured Desulfobulbus sp. TaxID=239745 RepID=UPI0029C906BB|nr:hypothetical protein [uncultured Desulfobulbus sp.]
MPGRLWTKANVISAILLEFTSGNPLNYTAVQKRTPALLRSAQRVFGSWGAAVAASGIDYGDICLYQSWSKDKIISRIQEWYRKGADLSWRNVSLKLDPPLAAAVLHGGRYMSWNDALAEAGIDPGNVRKYRKWSKQKVQQQLFELAEQGLALDQDTLISEAPALLAAIYRHGKGLVEERKSALRMKSDESQQILLPL